MTACAVGGVGATRVSNARPHPRAGGRAELPSNTEVVTFIADSAAMAPPPVVGALALVRTADAVLLTNREPDTYKTVPEYTAPP